MNHALNTNQSPCTYERYMLGLKSNKNAAQFHSVSVQCLIRVSYFTK